MIPSGSVIAGDAMADLLQPARGTKDILPDEQAYWQWIVQSFINRAESLGFARIETPTFEYAHVFTRGVGQTSDIVEKEMFEVKRLSRGEEGESDKEVTVLRPEGTAAVVRSYIQNGMQTWTQPVRLYYIESMFRYDRPQKGRYREHHQLGLEYFGDADSSADAMIIMAYWQLLQDIGLTDNIAFNMNSIGDEACRPKYRKKLKQYFEPYREQLCSDCQRRLDTNPLRILDCKNQDCQRIATGAPVILDELCADCKTHFSTLLEYLDELGIPYNINPRLVRGLDYYARTVFEVVDTADTARQTSISGGGRYDGLVKLYGGKDTPAVGTGIGIERLIEKLQERGIEPPTKQAIKVVVVPLGDKAKKMGLKLIQQLNQWGIGATGAFSKESLKAQLKYTDKLMVPLAVIVGTREVFDGTVMIRDMKTGVQDTTNVDFLEETVRERLK
jgi:histidyl-tRNA synthetase